MNYKGFIVAVEDADLFSTKNVSVLYPLTQLQNTKVRIPVIPRRPLSIVQLSRSIISCGEVSAIGLKNQFWPP